MNLFDAMYVYGLWVNYTITNGVNHKDGKALMEYVNGLRFVCKYVNYCSSLNGTLFSAITFNLKCGF